MLKVRWLAPWFLALLIALGAVAVMAPAAGAQPTQTPAVSPADALRQLAVVRQSIDRTLTLIKDGKADEAFAEAKSGYLSHFEFVEIPLRVVDAQLTSDAETKFAEIRGLINSHAPVSEVRANIIELRALIDDAERRLTDTGLSAPAVVFGQSFLIIFREGLEAVLLVSVLLGYLEAAKATQYRRPILWGMAGAAVATVVTSILPIALRTAEVVEQGVAAAGVASPVMVMRGDGGATDLARFRREPARTLYSGPAASVAGALRSSRIDDGVIVEVGGTSTNVAAIRRGRPALSYVQVASHATAIRALDVRVLGVAGGSMLRTRRGRVHGVGPRSAHIAGYAYACFLSEDDLNAAVVELVAPRLGDPADYLVIRLSDGRHAALTNTCAANALGIVHDDDYAHGNQAAALVAFALAGEHLRLPAEEVARRMLQASTQAVGDLVAAVARDHHLDHPAIVAVGGGAGALGRAVASAMGLEIVVPPNAEVISAIGDALSLVRAERERTFQNPTPADVQQLIADVEAEALRAGAGGASLDVRVEHYAERSALRVTVTGSVALSSGAIPGRSPASDADANAAARERGYGGATPVGHYWLATRSRRDAHVAVFDRYADLVIDVRGEAITNDDGDLAGVIARNSRRLGPVTIAPDAWVISGARFLQVPDVDPATILAAANALAVDGTKPTVIIGRE